MGLLCIAPYAYFATTPEYKGIALMGQDAEEHYLARIQAAYEGDWRMGNIFMPDKSVPYLMPGLGEVVVAQFGRAFGMAAPAINIATKALFPAGIFLLIYGFAFSISRTRSTALLAATAGMLATALMSNPREILAFMHGLSIVDGITWARPINPSMTGLVLFGSLWMLYRLHNRKPSLAEIATLGSLIGLSLYLSVYTWSFLGVLLLIVFGSALHQKDILRSGRIFAIGVLALVYATPFFINFVQARAHPAYSEVSNNLGAMASHSPELGLWLVVLLVVPVFFWPARLAQSRQYFIFCGAALFIVLNQHVLTGFYLQPGHYHWYITKPLTGIVLALVGMEFLRRWTPLWANDALCALAIAVLFTHGAFAQKHFYNNHAPEARSAQAYAPLFEYLQHEPPAAVLASPTLSIYAAIYTPRDTPNHPYGIFYLSSSSDVENAFAIEDKKDISWKAPQAGLTLLTTINGRFAIYRLPQK
ncbi:MAG: hypothetical protein JWL87_265 [Candidatus Adlerbacteria bacterium]|nr:hypothetical protein [Candidatus Adlerbacteria bacterium]